MLDPKKLEELAQQIAGTMPAGMKNMAEEVEKTPIVSFRNKIYPGQGKKVEELVEEKWLEVV